MSKWTKTHRDPSRTYQDEKAQKDLREAMRRVEELVAEAALGNDEAESEYVAIINRAQPGMDKKKERN